MEKQVCGHCREEKELSEFAPSCHGRKGTWCRACMRARYIPRPRPSRNVPEGHKYCTKCKTVKPEDQFYKTASAPHCKQCYKDWQRARYKPIHGTTDDPRDCTICGKSFTPKQRRATMYCSQVCKDRARTVSPAKRNARLLREYGISLEEYEALFARQGGRCAICGNSEPSGRWGGLHLDHNHKTSKVRGMLCGQCNHAIGLLRDDPALLRRAIDYLEASTSV